MKISTLLFEALTPRDAGGFAIGNPAAIADMNRSHFSGQSLQTTLKIDAYSYQR
jgi:hypothetical protein